MGKDGKILHIESKVKSGEHASQILDELAKLKIDKAPKKED